MQAVHDWRVIKHQLLRRAVGWFDFLSPDHHWVSLVISLKHSFLDQRPPVLGIITAARRTRSSVKLRRRNHPVHFRVVLHGLQVSFRGYRQHWEVTVRLTCVNYWFAQGRWILRTSQLAHLSVHIHRMINMAKRDVQVVFHHRLPLSLTFFRWIYAVLYSLCLRPLLHFYILLSALRRYLLPADWLEFFEYISRYHISKPKLTVNELAFVFTLFSDIGIEFNLGSLVLDALPSWVTFEIYLFNRLFSFQLLLLALFPDFVKQGYIVLFFYELNLLDHIKIMLHLLFLEYFPLELPGERHLNARWDLITLTWIALQAARIDTCIGAALVAKTAEVDVDID